MRVITYGGTLNVDYIQVGGRMWPVDVSSATGKFFFPVLNTANSDGRNEVRVYESPDVYWQLNKGKPHRDDFENEDDPQEAYDAAFAAYNEEFQAFRQNHEQWYKDRRQMQEDMGTFVDRVRLRQGCNQVAYPSEGRVARALSGVYQANQNSLA